MKFRKYNMPKEDALVGVASYHPCEYDDESLEYRCNVVWLHGYIHKQSNIKQYAVGNFFFLSKKKLLHRVMRLNRVVYDERKVKAQYIRE